jgi:Gnt-I system high-affinity gluconate transporter
MSLLIIFVCIILLVVLITRFNFNTFIAFLIVSILAGLMLGIGLTKVAQSVQKGIGDMMGSLVVIIVTGAMLGKLVAESGAAQQITSGMMKLLGEKYVQWALMITGFIIGIPLFYNVGFVLVVPFIFTVAYRYKLPAVYIGVPMLAAMSVTHGYLPPHPSPTALVAQFHANLGMTLFYGTIIAIPAVILAGPVFSRTVRDINSVPLQAFQAPSIPDEKLPGITNSILTSLLPVILLALTTILIPYVPEEGTAKNILLFVGDPAIVMLFSLMVATYTLGANLGTSMKKIGGIFGDAVKDVAMVLLIIAGSGAFKQVLIDSGVNNEVARMLGGLSIHPLILGWLIAAVIRVCVDSATVAGLTAASIIAPMMTNYDVDPNMMVLAVGAGSLLFSHVNDSGFWLFKEYFNLSIKDTIRSWSLMETIISIVGLAGVLVINFVISL